MEDLIQNPSIAEQFRRKGFEQARKFTWQSTAEKTIALYREVAKS
jgi:glycosyltransferase involved in cell wall biosynthesis